METMQKLAALEGDGYYSLSNVVTVGGGENVTVLTTFIDANATVPVSDSDTVFANKYQGTGKGSAVDFSGYSQDVVIDLNYDSSTELALLVAGDTIFQSVTAVRGSDGTSVIDGSKAAETIYAGKGGGTINAGAGRDVLYSYDGSDKTGATEFFFGTGSGKDTLYSFEAYTGDNAETTDRLVSDGGYVSLSSGLDIDVKITNGSVRLSMNSSDQLTLRDMENKAFYFDNTLIEVGNDLEYNSEVVQYIGGSNATLNVGDADGEVNMWLCMGNMTTDWPIFDDIKAINASALSYNATLVGDSYEDNIIVGGTAVNSLWGGIGGDDTLYGGGSANAYFYLNEGGNDVIENAQDGDIVNLLGIELSNYDFNSLIDGVSENAVEIKFNDGGSIKVNNDADVTFRIIDGHKWTVNRETKEWSYQGQD